MIVVCEETSPSSELVMLKIDNLLIEDAARNLLLQPMGYIHPVPNSETKEEKKRKEDSRSTTASERKMAHAGRSVKAWSLIKKRYIAMPLLGESRNIDPCMHERYPSVSPERPDK